MPGLRRFDQQRRRAQALATDTSEGACEGRAAPALARLGELVEVEEEAAQLVEAFRAELEDGLREGPSWIAFACENGTVYHTYTVMAPDPFVAPYYSFLLERTPKPQPAEPRAWRKDEYPD